ncbi:MAG: EAL domain-containing protein [Thioalkalispiraceae bacterium]
MTPKFLNSLRGRYALVTLFLSALLLAGSFFAQYNLTQSRDTATVNITTRNQLLQYSRHIRTTIREHHESLVLFLLMPNGQHSTEYLRLALEQAIKYTERLAQHPWVEKHNKSDELKQLQQELHNYDQAVHELIKIRKDPDQQYPSMAIARNSMQGISNTVNNALSIALRETVDESNNTLTPVYHHFMQLRHHWLQMIAMFRIYLANNIGSYDLESIPLQEKAIRTLHQTMRENLDALARLSQQDKLGFQAEDSLNILQQAHKTWLGYYMQIINLHRSENWRADVAAIRERLEPHNEKIWNILQSLDIAIESSGNSDVNNLAQIAEKQVAVLWLLTLLGLVFLFIGFYFLEYLVLRPIANVSLALKHEAIGDEEDNIIIHSNITETRNLVDAFDEMRQQVHQRQEQLEHQALHDALTGLANRTLLYDRLQHAIRTSRRENQKIALLMIDLDRFKEVNDTLGHQIGDALLVEIGQRLVETLREADTVARLGGDEFAVLLSNTNEEEAHYIAEKIQQAIAQVFHVEDIKLHVKSSIGIVLYPKHGNNAQALLQKSDVAMYVAKRNKLGQAVYNPEHDQHSVGRLALMSDLRNALQEDQLELHFQPKVALATNDVIGFEALLRWRHPKYGYVSPTKIIPVAEQTGDIGAVTQWVIEKSLNQLEAWQQRDIVTNIAINLSMYNLYDSVLIDRITELLHEHITLCHHLTFEITESAMMEQPEQAVEVISHFDRLGVRIAIDDFGTGFSSLSYLKRLPVDELKIDKSFVLEIHNDDSDAVIVRSTIDLAHNLGLEVVAEGIENQDIHDILTILGCDHGQGYYISHPLHASELEQWLEPGHIKISE